MNEEYMMPFDCFISPLRVKNTFLNIRIFATEEAKISEISLPIIILGISPTNHPFLMTNFGGLSPLLYITCLKYGLHAIYFPSFTRARGESYKLERESLLSILY